jgi:hypothetical protein
MTTDADDSGPRDTERVHLTIYADQREWADDNHVNLSSLVREKLDEAMD